MAKIDFKKLDTYRKTFDGILQVKKHVGSEDDLPVTGAQNGDIYTVGDNNTLYMFNNGEWGMLGSGTGGGADWNIDDPNASGYIANKPFGTTTFPVVELQNGLIVTIEGGAEYPSEEGKIGVKRTYFNVQVINKSDNTVLDNRFVIPLIASQTTSKINMLASYVYPSINITGADGVVGALEIRLGWTETTAFSGVVRTWDGVIISRTADDLLQITTFQVNTPADTSAAHGVDYDKVSINVEPSDSYPVITYQKESEDKLVDRRYLYREPVYIYGAIDDNTDAVELMRIGLTGEIVKAIALGEANDLYIGSGGKFGALSKYEIIRRMYGEEDGVLWYGFESRCVTYSDLLINVRELTITAAEHDGLVNIEEATSKHYSYETSPSE